MKLSKNFYNRSAEIVSKGMLGKLLVRIAKGHIFIGKIVETEAYFGDKDKASHAYRGKTKRNEAMFGESGHAYIYFTYGMHWMLNVVTGKESEPSAVLIRAVEPLYDSRVELDKMSQKDRRSLGAGPARLTKWMQITGELNKYDLISGEKLYLTEKEEHGGVIFSAQKYKRDQIVTTKRIGIESAGAHKDLPLRFYIKESLFVSKP